MPHSDSLAWLSSARLVYGLGSQNTGNILLCDIFFLETGKCVKSFSVQRNMFTNMISVEIRFTITHVINFIPKYIFFTSHHNYNHIHSFHLNPIQWGAKNTCAPLLHQINVGSKAEKSAQLFREQK